MNKFYLLAALLIASTAAVADSEGNTGRVIGVTYFGEYSTLNSQKKYMVRVLQDDQTTRSYTSGGSKCSNKGLNSSEINALSQALLHKNLRIRPYFLAGAGSTSCIVAFDLIQMPQFYDQVPAQ